MAEVKKDNTLANLEERYTQIEKYVLDHKQPVSIATSVVVGLLLLYFGFTKYYLPKREDDAQSQMFVAQKYLDRDSTNLALNGDNNYPGFLKIADNYKWTKASNLACYSAGLEFLHEGKFDEALKYLKKASFSDKIVEPYRLGAIGDAYSELNKYDDAVDYYRKAAYYVDNDASSPYFIDKAAKLLLYQKKYSAAKPLFEELKKKYPTTTQGRDADKYLAEIQSAMS